MLDVETRQRSSVMTRRHGARASPGAGTVLVIESSPEVAEIIGEQIELAGRRALACCGARSGLDALLRHAGSVDLVLLDVSLPHFRYLAVAEQIWSVLPGVPVALLCGAEPLSLRSTVPGRRFSGVLRKPFRMAALVGLMDELEVGAAAS